MPFVSIWCGMETILFKNLSQSLQCQARAHTNTLNTGRSSECHVWRSKGFIFHSKGGTDEHIYGWSVSEMSRAIQHICTELKYIASWCQSLDQRSVPWVAIWTELNWFCRKVFAAAEVHTSCKLRRIGPIDVALFVPIERNLDYGHRGFAVSSSPSFESFSLTNDLAKNSEKSKIRKNGDLYLRYLRNAMYQYSKFLLAKPEQSRLSIPLYSTKAISL